MRVINHIFLAAAAAALALVSCTKETTDNTENTQGQKSGVRTITVAFANPDTRTSPTNVTGGIQPVWAKGDQLTISNGSTIKTIDVPTDAVGKTTFTFTTDLTGTIEVYYPGGDNYSDYWDASGDVKISSTQSGEFAEANLCKGTVAEDGTNLTLTNQTALFQVTPPSGVKQFTITSLKTIVDGQRTNGTAVNIADNATVITVGDNTVRDTYYVALASGVNLSDLSFEYTTDDATHGAMKGIPMKDIAEGKDEVKAGSVYIITANYWHDYVKVGGKKWATMNVGATSSTDYGDYFAWGETTGHAATTNGANAFVFGTNNAGFAMTNCPYAVAGTSQFRKYVPSSKSYYLAEGFSGDTKTVLDLEDDAAFCNWGGAWRMPTQGDFDTFISDASYSNGNFEHKGVTFPAAGGGSDATLFDAGSRGNYWSSSLSTDYPYGAFCLYFGRGEVFTDNNSRYSGRSVRPLSE